jgi:hypothetical protein
MLSLQELHSRLQEPLKKKEYENWFGEVRAKIEAAIGDQDMDHVVMDMAEMQRGKPRTQKMLDSIVRNLGAVFHVELSPQSVLKVSWALDPMESEEEGEDRADTSVDLQSSTKRREEEDPLVLRPRAPSFVLPPPPAPVEEEWCMHQTGPSFLTLFQPWKRPMPWI